MSAPILLAVFFALWMVILSGGKGTPTDPWLGVALGSAVLAVITWLAWQWGRGVILGSLMFRAQEGKPTGLSIWFMASLVWRVLVFAWLVFLLYRCIT